MRVFKVRVFARFQRKERLSDAALCRAVRDIEAGLIDADLGNGLVKHRVARPGRGKRGGYRTIIAYRAQDRAVFLFGFAKSTKADLTPGELQELLEVGASWLSADDKEIEAALEEGRAKELDCGTEH